jgi:hypothetical protein
MTPGCPSVGGCNRQLLFDAGNGPGVWFSRAKKFFRRVIDSRPRSRGGFVGSALADSDETGEFRFSASPMLKSAEIGASQLNSFPCRLIRDRSARLHLTKIRPSLPFGTHAKCVPKEWRPTMKLISFISPSIEESCEWYKHLDTCDDHQRGQRGVEQWVWGVLEVFTKSVKHSMSPFQFR